MLSSVVIASIALSLQPLPRVPVIQQPGEDLIDVVDTVLTALKPGKAPSRVSSHPEIDRKVLELLKWSGKRSVTIFHDVGVASAGELTQYRVRTRVIGPGDDVYDALISSAERGGKLVPYDSKFPTSEELSYYELAQLANGSLKYGLVLPGTVSSVRDQVRRQLVDRAVSRIPQQMDALKLKRAMLEHHRATASSAEQAARATDLSSRMNDLADRITKNEQTLREEIARQKKLAAAGEILNKVGQALDFALLLATTKATVDARNREQIQQARDKAELEHILSTNLNKVFEENTEHIKQVKTMHDEMRMLNSLIQQTLHKAGAPPELNTGEITIPAPPEIPQIIIDH